jgi:hypothetical protein
MSVAGRPSVWVALSVLLLAVTPPEDPSSSGATLSDLAIIIAGLLAAREVLRRPAMARTVPAIGFYAIGAVTLVAAAVARNFPQNYVGGLRFVELFVLTPLAVMVGMRTRADALLVLGSLVGLGLVEGALGLFQFATGTGAGIGDESIRAVGTFGAYNIGTLAHLTALGVVICLSVVVVRTGRVRWIAAAAGTVMLLANLASLSRGAYVAVAVAVVVVLGVAGLPAAEAWSDTTLIATRASTTTTARPRAVIGSRRSHGGRWDGASSSTARSALRSGCRENRHPGVRS